MRDVGGSQGGAEQRVTRRDRAVSLTETTTIELRDPGLRRFGRVLRAIGLVGVVTGVAAVAAGLWLLQDVDVLFGRSLTLTVDSLRTVDQSLAVAGDTIAVVGDGLGQAEQTSQGLEASLTEGAALLDETSRILSGDVASSLESVEATMPTLIEVGATIDSTLRAVGTLSGDASYDPEEPFDQTLRELQEDLDGIPDDLRAQAATIDDAGDNLREVGAQGEAVAASIGEIGDSIDRAGEVLAQYQVAATDARALIEDTTSDLGRRVLVLRVLVVLLGVAFVAGQALPLYLGHRLAELPRDDEVRVRDDDVRALDDEVRRLDDDVRALDD